MCFFDEVNKNNKKSYYAPLYQNHNKKYITGTIIIVGGNKYLKHYVGRREEILKYLQTEIKPKTYFNLYFLLAWCFTRTHLNAKLLLYT